MQPKSKFVVKVLVEYEVEAEDAQHGRKVIRELCREMKDGRYPLPIAGWGSHFEKGSYDYKCITCKVTR